MMENRMTMTTDEVFTAVRMTAPGERNLNRDMPVNDELRDETPNWMLANELRGALNALALCVRVLEGSPNDAEGREYVRHITAATQRIERLLAKRQLGRKA